MNKVKPKEDGAKKKLRVMNVHGYIEAQDVLNKIVSLENEKQEKCSRAEEKKEQKNIQKELFYRCKLQCLCEGPCPARLLKECPHCHSVLKSTCSKMACRIND